MKQFIATAVAATVIALPALGQSAITQWTFEGDTLTPSTGSGTAALFGGTTGTFAGGSGGGRAWNTSTYAAQGEGSGSRGVSFLAGTTGYESISVSFEHRSSGTGSRWAQVDYTLDGGSTWTTGFWNNGGGLSPHDFFYSFTVDFSSVAGASDNAGFGFRIVSIFSPTAFNQNSTLSYGANEAYMRANADAKFAPEAGLGTGNYATTGTWRFDNVTVSGTLIPAPGAVALLGIAGISARRRRAN